MKKNIKMPISSNNEWTEKYLWHQHFTIAPKDRRHNAETA